MGPTASTRGRVDPFLAMEVLAEAAALEENGADIIHLEVGQPGAPAPEPVLAAARHALIDGRLGYTPAAGVSALRARIARHYADTYGVDVSPERIVVTTGSSAGFTLAFLASLDAGDSVLTTAPGYPAYRNIMGALGLKAIEAPTHAAQNWAMTPEHVAAARANAKAVLVASPNNPTGTVLQPDALSELIAACRDAGLWFISDEIYHGLVYEGRAETALAFDHDAIVINSFSKYYCMTGWRIGWMVVPERLIQPIERLAQNLFISPPDLSQRAALAAFDCSIDLEAVKAGYAANRARLSERLPELGFTDISQPDGAFYIYAGVSRFTNDSTQFARRLLREAGVAVTPGLDFDPERGHLYMRFSFAGAEQAIDSGLERLADWLGRG